MDVRLMRALISTFALYGRAQFQMNGLKTIAKIALFGLVACASATTSASTIGINIAKVLLYENLNGEATFYDKNFREIKTHNVQFEKKTEFFSSNLILPENAEYVAGQVWGEHRHVFYPALSGPLKLAFVEQVGAGSTVNIDVFSHLVAMRANSTREFVKNSLRDIFQVLCNRWSINSIQPCLEPITNTSRLAMSVAALSMISQKSPLDEVQEWLDGSQELSGRSACHLETCFDWDSGMEFVLPRLSVLRATLNEAGLHDLKVEPIFLAENKVRAGEYLKQISDTVILTTGDGYELTYLQSPVVEVSVKTQADGVESSTFIVDLEHRGTKTTNTQIFSRSHIKGEDFVTILTNSTQGDEIPSSHPFSNHSSVIMLLDFIPASGPGLKVIAAAREHGVPIIHYPHELYDKYGIPFSLQPLRESDFVSRRASKDYLVDFRHWGRQVDNVFIMGYGPAECVLFTRYNSFAHLLDRYPSINFIPVKEGVDNLQPAAKWAIATFQDRHGTTSARSLTTALTGRLEAAELDYFSTAEKKFNNKKFIRSVPPTVLNESRKNQGEIFDSETVIVVTLGTSSVLNDFVASLVVERPGTVHVNMQGEKIFLNGKPWSATGFESLFAKDHIFIVAGQLSNRTQYFRAGFPSDFSCSFNWTHAFCGKVVMVVDLLEVSVGDPFRSLGYTETAALSILIDAAAKRPNGPTWIYAGELLELMRLGRS